MVNLIHTIELVYSHEGTQEWRCSICGRTVQIEYDPFLRVVLEPGDSTVGHSGLSMESEVL